MYRKSSMWPPPKRRKGVLKFLGRVPHSSSILTEPLAALLQRGVVATAAPAAARHHRGRRAILFAAKRDLAADWSMRTARRQTPTG
jgi:hypothetical protein